MLNIAKFFNKLIYGGGIAFDMGKWIILAIVLIVLFSRFFYSPFIVDGVSMEPNLHDKTVALMNRGAFVKFELARQDVVVVAYPGDPENKTYVKRTIGLPGETVEIKDSQVYINGKKIAQDYLPGGTLTEPDGKWKLASNEYFMMGDNRENSNDSRVFGPIEKRFVRGKVTATLFPKLRTVNN